MHYRLLGELEVLGDDGTPIEIPAPKRRQLLGVLLLSPNQPVSADRLMDALWEANPPPAALESLQAHVSRLRREIGQDRIVTEASGYSVRVSPGELDAESAEADLRRAREAVAQGRWHTARQLYRQALARWRGPALADFEGRAFAVPESARLEALRATALEDAIEADLELGQHEQAIPELERLVAEVPYRERPWRQLMVALYRSGRQADALAAYRRLRRTLHEHLGIDPSPDAQELEGRILRQDPALGRPDAGQVQPEVRLPASISPLYGRSEMLDQALALLREHRLVTLTGPGGVGKTRLAVHVATAAVPNHPDGTLFVDLSATREPAAVMSRVGEIAGGGERPDAVIGERRMLLVLDNFEQVLEAAGDIARLLEQCPNLHALVTSRAPLRVRGEQRLEVQPLARAEAAAMFLDRVRATVSAAEIDTGIVSEIVATLDGLPLAIELAASRIVSIPATELLDRLGARLDVLSRGPRDAADRHRTLRGTIAWSHEILDARAQVAFRRLGVLESDFDLEAALAVTEADIDVLADLVDHSLVRRSGERYAMLDSIAEFALSEARESGDLPAARTRHMRHYAALVSAARRIEGVDAGRRPEWIALCAAERANTRRAFEWAVESGDGEAVQAIVVGMGTYLLLVGAMEEGTRWGRHAVEVAADESDVTRLRTLSIAAEFPKYGGSLTEALDLKRRCLALARHLGDAAEEGIALDDIAWVHAAMDDDREAQAFIDRALRLHDVPRRAPTDRNHTIHTAAEVALRGARVDDALRYLADMEAHEAIASPVPDQQVERSTIAGLILAAAERPADAAAFLQAAIEAGVKIGFRIAVADALDGLATIARTDDPGRAALLLGMADRARAEAGSRPWLPAERQRTMAIVREALGESAFATGHAEGHGTPFAAMSGSAIRGPGAPVLLSRGDRTGAALP